MTARNHRKLFKTANCTQPTPQHIEAKVKVLSNTRQAKRPPHDLQLQVWVQLRGGVCITSCFHCRLNFIHMPAVSAHGRLLHPVPSRGVAPLIHTLWLHETSDTHTVTVQAPWDNHAIWLEAIVDFYAQYWICAYEKDVAQSCMHTCTLSNETPLCPSNMHATTHPLHHQLLETGSVTHHAHPCCTNSTTSSSKTGRPGSR